MSVDDRHWNLTEDQEELRLRARQLAGEVVAPRAAEVDRTEAYPWDVVEALQEAGFMGMTVPEAYGGPERSFLEAVLVVEEMARQCGVTGRIAVEANMGALSAIMAYGTKDQKRLAAELVLGGDTPALCIPEPGAGSAASQMTTRADRRGDRYILNGKKHWITGGGVSRLHLVFARVFAEADCQRWSASREFVSSGVANVAAAVSGSFPVGGSFSRSSLNRLAGARTRWSGLVTGATVLAFLPFADVLAPLPRATLGGVVIAAVVGLVKPRQLLGMARSSQSNAVVAWVTFCATLALSPRVEQGVLVGILVSLAVGLRRRRP